ncbi:hypothetical protein TEA_018337 [Camellia sinensis var. sinensis]|uniref:acetyl-CoA carboxytransferase n=1 Tax=Camellia sinensis var. sinensis TaxID=542762 RepID=A0A4S4EL72_CAMSN|nr:hypothetical protein TEA_018337 [Camellia sinensis var. sinensis]
MYFCKLNTPTEYLGPMYAVLVRRRARVLKEEMQEGSPLFTVHAYVPVAESFGFADELRRWTSGASSALLTARMTTKSDSTATASGGCVAAVAEEEEDEDELTPPGYGGFALASPEACAAILWKSAKASPKVFVELLLFGLSKRLYYINKCNYPVQAAEKLKITAGELCKLQIADGIVPEPLGGGHADPYWTSQQIKTAIVDAMDELIKMDTQELLKHRMLKFRKLGGFQEGIPADPKKKINMKKKEEPILNRGKTTNLELENEVEKLKQQIQEAKESTTEHPELGLNEMIEKLKREVDHEFSEAVKAMGLKDRLVMLREEFEKSRNSKDQPMNLALKGKIEKLKDEFNQGLSAAPNYASLKHKLDMLEEISKAKNLSEKDNKIGTLKQEINEKFTEVLDQPDMKEKIEALKKEIEDSGVSTFAELNQDLKEKILQVKEETEIKFADVLKSLGMHVEPPSFSDVKVKIEELNDEINDIIEDVINSSDLKNKIEQLKLEVAKAGKTPDLESKRKIMVLEQQIKQSLAEVMDSTVLKEKHEKLKAEIFEAMESSGGLYGNLIKGNMKDGNSKYEGLSVKVNLEANRSMA